MKVEITKKDYRAIREMMMGVIDFEPSDTQIWNALMAYPEIMGLALTWGWDGDTELRDKLASALEEQVAG